MTTAEPQQLSRVEEFLHANSSNSDEPSNANNFAQRDTTLHSPTVVESRRKKALHIPPPAPSPPSRPLPVAALRSPRNHSPFNNTMTVDDVEPQSQWLFTEEEIQNSPSVQDGITSAEEGVRRAKGVNFITQAGILLKIPQVTLGTAAVFFHRFYMRYSMVSEKGTGIHHYVGSSLP
jgi:protein BUR2